MYCIFEMSWIPIRKSERYGPGSHAHKDQSDSTSEEV
jgi:hypothetical protein